MPCILSPSCETGTRVQDQQSFPPRTKVMDMGAGSFFWGVAKW